MKIPNKVDIQHFFDSDRAILIVCIFIALIFWILVKLSLTFSSSNDFQIRYNLPPGKAFVSSPPADVKATLKGTGWDLISYQFKNKANSISFELNDVSSQAINASMVIDKIQETISPTTLLVSDIDMDFIFVQMENEMEVKVPIRLNTDIHLATQSQLADSITIKPDSVIITGPLTETASIEFWDTEVLGLTNLKNDLTVQVPLVAPKNNEIHLSVDSVIVNISVEQFTERSFFVPISIKNAPDSLKTFPETAKLSCLVGFSKYNEINKSSFELVADLKGIALNSEENAIPVLLTKQPPFVRAVNFQPKSVEFFFVDTNRDSTLKVPK